MEAFCAKLSLCLRFLVALCGWSAVAPLYLHAAEAASVGLAEVKAQETREGFFLLSYRNTNNRLWLETADHRTSFTISTFTGPGLQAGDEILKIDGVPVAEIPPGEALGTLYIKSRSWPPGKVDTYKLARANQGKLPTPRAVAVEVKSKHARQPFASTLTLVLSEREKLLRASIEHNVVNPTDPIDVRSTLAEFDLAGVGTPAPVTNGITVEGNDLKLSSYHGRVVLLTFLDPRDEDSLDSVRDYRRLEQVFSGKGLVILHVSPIEERAAAATANAASHIPWPSFWNGTPPRTISRAWGVSRWPVTFLLDRNGVIRYRNPDSDLLSEAIPSLLAEKAP